MRELWGVDLRLEPMESLAINTRRNPMRSRRVLAALMIAGMLGVAVTAACAQSDTPPPAPVEIQSIIEPQTMRIEYAPGLSGSQNGLWASGNGKMSAAPDLAYLAVGVRAMEPTVAEANAEAAEALTAMIGVLNDSGIQDSDIQTSSLNIRQERDSRQVTRCPEKSDDEMEKSAMAPATEGATVAAPVASVSMEATMEQAMSAMVAGFGMGSQDECYTTYEQVVTGYTVSQQLTAKVRAMDSIGGLVDQLVEAGRDLTRIDGINFTIDDPAPLAEQAREKAIQDLLSRAEKMADAAGVQLGDLEYLSESGASVLEAREEAFFRSAPTAMAMDAASVSTSISAGEVTVTANVTGAFSIGEDGEE